jgi:mono/diheme cytochrome c family protein/glucose/arabinose dehydrogenase/F0F1-type ATP synthase delta subunit
MNSKLNYIYLSLIFPILFMIGKSEVQETPVNSPEEEQKTFVLDKGLKIQLVAAEPMVEDPVTLNFDAEGRLWVVEMRGYMPDIAGNNETQPIGRVSVLEDLNGDGVMDKSTVFMDSLVLPRALALIDKGVLVAENQVLWEVLDLNDDLKPDTKTLVDKDYASNAAPEHTPNGLLRNVDNWYYNAKSRFRYKKIAGQWVKDSTEFRGQWGICQDDKGRLHYNYNWSQLHADLVPPNYLSRNKNHAPTSGIDVGLTNDRRVYPILDSQAVNRGYIPGVLSAKNRLAEFTAACSPLVYRENTLPKEYFGNAFVCEPAGNLVKRSTISENGLELTASDPYAQTEFLASTDGRFRPVNLASAPDGGLYVLDMYKGVIQHKVYVTPYLRDLTLQRGLDKYLHKGRIWRIVPDNWQPKPIQKWTTLTAADLIEKLSSADGWQRDMAQKLLVEKGDKSVEIALLGVVKKGNSLARFHALWTLEGLNLLNPAWLLPLVTDKDILISNTALRLIENFAQQDKTLCAKLQKRLLKLSKTDNIAQLLQITLSSSVLETEARTNLLATILDKTAYSPIMRDAVMSSLNNSEFAFLRTLKTHPKWQTPALEKEIFMEMLTTALVQKGQAQELEAVLGYLNTDTKTNNWQNKSILMSLVVQSNNVSNPIKLAQEPPLFSNKNSGIEDFALEKLKSMFAWQGHTPSKKIDANKIVLNSEDQKLFAKGRIQYLSTCSGCHGSDGKGIARFAPTLVGSEWVTGDETRLALIILHGLEGAIEVKGKKYDAPEILPVMPAHATLDDATITNILTYIRNEWGNNGGGLSKQLVSKTRFFTTGRAVPWTADDLNKHIEKLPASK